MESSFRDASNDLNKHLSKELRKKQGIFFTPRDARMKLFDKLNEFGITQFQRILEPSFGSGEFLHDLMEFYPSSTIYGVEFNATMYEKATTNSTFSPLHLVQQDFLKWSHPDKMDLIIGNPPYFVVKDKNPACMTGRGNIFVQFIYKSIHEHLADGGILAFVLPTSFYNCSYYEPCRTYIKEHTTILHVETIQTHYYETNQDTMILILKKEPSSSVPPPFVFSYQGLHTISPYAKELSKLIENTKTLQQLGFQVKTGNVVWNQHKDQLSNDKGTLIIYSSNLVQGQLILNNLKNDKKQYIQNFNGEKIIGPAILVSRGYGNKFAFNYVFIGSEYTFHGENHINVITPMTEDAVQSIDSVLASFANPKTLKFIQMYIGNGALSKSELETVLPIFI